MLMMRWGVSSVPLWRHLHTGEVIVEHSDFEGRAVHREGGVIWVKKSVPHQVHHCQLSQTLCIRVVRRLRVRTAFLDSAQHSSLPGKGCTVVLSLTGKGCTAKVAPS